jgi:hypothetical protein
MLAMRLSCRMSTRTEAAARITLLQGTLDMPILRTLLFGPQARFYELTKTGRRQLIAETDQWRRLATAIGRILGPNEV